MQGWNEETRDGMGDSVPRAESAKTATPPLKNGNELRETGYLIAVGSRTARFRRKHREKISRFVILAVLLALLCLSIVMTVLYAKLKRNKSFKVCESKECLRSAANLALSIDKTADPCEDFYQYACGNWPKDHPRPDAYRSYDWFRDKQTKVYSMVRDFLTKNTTGQPKPVQQAKDMYAACMDTGTLEKRGVKPIMEILQSIGLPQVPTYTNLTEDTDYSAYTFDWLDAVIKIKTQLGMDVLIGFDIFTDPKNSSVYRLVMGSPETTNPFPSMLNERKRHNTKKTQSHFVKLHQHYTEDFKISDAFLRFKEKIEAKSTESDEEEEKLKQIYVLLYAELMKLFATEAGVLKSANMSEVETDQNFLVAAKDFFTFYSAFYELETDNSTETEYSSTIPEYTIDEIQQHTDQIVENNEATPVPIWKKYLEGIFNVSDVQLEYDKEKILVSDPDLKYMSLMASMLAKTPPVAIELYVWLKVVEVMAVHTTNELRILFQRTYNDLRSKKADSGVPARSLQCASAVNDLLGMAVSYGIADPNFFNVTKPKIEIMLNEMKNALSSLIGKAKWMDDNTKLATYEKIIKMKTLIGFPEWLLEEGKLEDHYKGIEIDKSKHLENMINIIQHKVKRALNKIHKLNDFSWSTDPTEVNAYHTYQENTITIPIVMLQYPFYDLGLDSLNYGSLGTVLGHEITHGFDNFGRTFDKDGNSIPWWSNDTIELFVNMTQCFVHQYAEFYLPELDEYIDGKKTLAENIADNGGLREAFGAFKEHLRKTGPEQKLPGFEEMNSEQLFFLSYGNLWCGVSTEDSLKAELEDEHSPHIFRARGSLQNTIDFAKAWRCPKKSTMNPNDRCIIF